MRSRSKPVKWDDLRMEFISNCTADAISKAAQSLKDGHLVAFPTETVYGLGANATNEKAVSRIYSVKGRPIGHPLIVHISSINKLEQWATNIPDYAIKLAREFWPGPMTLILPRTDLAKDFITGGQNNVGLRVPAQPLALALLKKFEELGGEGVAAPSANRFSAVSPTSAEAVSDELGKELFLNDLILDGGECEVGIESTIINCTKTVPELLRPGFVSFDQIKDCIQSKITNFSKTHSLRYSGQSKKHYSPKASVELNTNANVGDGFIALKFVPTPKGAIRLASPENNRDFARVLYKTLREADRLKLSRVVVELPTAEDIGTAIIDRLTKAANK